ncbi:MAG: phosphoribosylanthranilate isomerase [Urechidicola sp.]|nr:phosphoribosylanthranilate isomerase [Urechidicola sp.]
MKIKVCGMRDCDNIEELVKLAPDYIGFIFYDKSKRFVTDFPNVEIPSTIKKVGVFVNESVEVILDLVNKNKLDVIQLHGDESFEYCMKLNREIASSFFLAKTKRNVITKEETSKVISLKEVEIIKAFSLDKYFDFSITKEYESSCDLFIFDSKGEGYGGTGLKYNWTILNNYKGETPFLLSGGIGENDAELILSFLRKQESNQCVGVDLNSGFEDTPGVKNIKKLSVFKDRLYEEE